MRRDLGVYGGLLAVSLGAAYWASLPEAETGGDEERVEIVGIDPKSVSEVAITSKDGEATIDAAAVRDQATGRYWVAHTRTEPVKAPAKKEEPKDPHAGLLDTGTAASTGTDTSAATGSVVPPEPKVTKERFLTNEKMDEFLKGLNPLVAARVIGKVDDAALEEFGLKDRGPKVTVKGEGGKPLFSAWLGKRSYGSRNRFVLEEVDGKPGRVLLIGDEGLENLERAPLRMYERKLVGVEVEEVSKVELKAGERVKRMSHTQRDKNGELVWSDDEENAPPKPSYDSWMDKINKLRLTAYADEAQEQTLKTTAPFLEVGLEKDGKEVDRLVFKKLAGEKPEYFVTSKFLGVHAKVVPARAEPIEKDLDALMGEGKS
jgi:hypothetical protein